MPRGTATAIQAGRASWMRSTTSSGTGWAFDGSSFGSRAFVAGLRASSTGLPCLDAQLSVPAADPQRPRGGPKTFLPPVTLALYLVETNPVVIARCQVGADRAGIAFRVRAVLPGSPAAPGDAADDYGQVAPLLLRLERTAAVLDCSPATVKRLIRAGDLPAVKVNGSTRVRVTDLEDYVDRLADANRSPAA